MWKKISVVIDIFLVILIAFVGYVQISMLISKKQNFGVPRIFGTSMLYVATDSMNDPGQKGSIPPGYAVIIEQVSPSAIKACTPIEGPDKDGNITILDYEKNGDVVTFFWKDINYVDTHRVISKTYDEATHKYTFTTMGDNPVIHQKFRNIQFNKLAVDLPVEEWGQDVLVGKLKSASRGLGQFLEIASPEAAAILTVKTGEKHFAWFFPVAILVPILGIALSYVIKGGINYSKEKKAREAKINEALLASGIDLNDEIAVEAFKTKEEMKLDIKEEMQKEFEKAKKEALKEIEKNKNGKED